MDDFKMQDSILRMLHSSPGREAILVPTMFTPPIMLSNIFRLGGVMKNKGYTTAPQRRQGGWHMKLLDAGVSYCETQAKPVSPQMSAHRVSSV
jgi:hypothetical protein